MACRQLLLHCPGVPVDLRLPHLGSPRAQRMISTWVGLTPQLYLPVGVRSFYRPLLRGVANAVAATGRSDVTAIVGGVTDVKELVRLKESASTFGSIQIGGSLLSVGAVAAGVRMVAEGFPVWVDIRALIRSYFGFPSALSLAGEVWEEQVASGAMAVNPTASIAADLRSALNRFVTDTSSVAGSRVGADCGIGVGPTIARQLYDCGFRTFSVADSETASIRLLLGQFASEVDDV